MSWFSFLGSQSSPTELPDIYPIPVSEKDFVSIDVKCIYKRILVDVLERTQGISDELKVLLWDNCLASEKQDGLVTLVAKAMVNKSELFLIYNPALKMIRQADRDEQAQIKADYLQRGESSVGIFITFKNYELTDMVKFYSQLQYCAVGGLWKQSNITKALQLKFNDMRASVALNDQADIKTQAINLATALKNGRDVYLDAKDIVETATVDMTATNSQTDFITQKRSFYLGLPASYLIGEHTSTMGDTGKKDGKAIERGLKAYYFSIVKPIIEGIFKIRTTFKSEDSEGLSAALETLKTMDITSDEYLSRENKTLIVNKSFGLDENEKGSETNEVNNDTSTEAPRNEGTREAN